MSVNSGALSVRVVWRVCEDPGESHLRGGLSQAASVKQIVELASSGLVVDRSIRLFPDKGVIAELLGERGVIDMGISREATVEEAVLRFRRRRRHRTCTLNDIESELSSISLNPDDEDLSLWIRSSGYKLSFSTQETWELLRENKTACDWACGVWFAYATPKFSFMVWLAIKDRLSTMDRVAKWSRGIDEVCALCKAAKETRSHLFFDCAYTAQVWEYVAKGLLGSSHTKLWPEILSIITDKTREKKSLFCICYAFQAALYVIWRERNKVIHGEKMMPLAVLKRVTEKGIRNRISLLSAKKIKGKEDLLQYWFSTRL
ncbi:hypothetical protein Bca101_018034 [Brassica carinata]